VSGLPPRRAARVDKSQTDIVDALRKLGIGVEIIGKPLDLLVWSRAACPHCGGALPAGKTEIMEVKNPERTSEQPNSRLTKDQVKFIARWPGKIHVVETVDEAIREVLGDRVLR